MRLEVTAPWPDKCQLVITQAVTHPLSHKTEHCLTRAISHMTPYHYAARLVKSDFLFIIEQCKCINISNVVLFVLTGLKQLCIRCVLSYRICKKMCCLLEKFTHLAKILHDCRSMAIATNFNPDHFFLQESPFPFVLFQLHYVWHLKLILVTVISVFVNLLAPQSTVL